MTLCRLSSINSAGAVSLLRDDRGGVLWDEQLREYLNLAGVA